MQVSAQARIQIVVKGRVQGVYYRASTIHEARRLGLTGWVMNRRDGAVELVAEGPAAQIEQLVAWCRKGPEGARVSAVDLLRQEFRGEFADFTIRHSLD